MIVRADLPYTVSPQFKGGDGEVLLKDLTTGKKPANVRVFNEMVLNQGCSIGFHTHTEDSEIIYVLEGEGICSEGGRESRVGQGDTLVCYAGESHSLRNECERPFRYLAVIIQN